MTQGATPDVGFASLITLGSVPLLPTENASSHNTLRSPRTRTFPHPSPVFLWPLSAAGPGPLCPSSPCPRHLPSTCRGGHPWELA